MYVYTYRCMYIERVLDLDAVDTHTQQGNYQKSISSTKAIRSK